MNIEGVTQEDKTIALLTHLGGIFFGFIPSLVVWLIKKDSSPFVAEQAKEALNFQITMLIAFAIAYVLILVVIGILLIWALVVANLVLCIVAGVKANSGESYRYPFALRLIQ
ncbi:MAG: DUF4870 domain-containing protein [Burkholderiales bacterium]